MESLSSSATATTAMAQLYQLIWTQIAQTASIVDSMRTHIGHLHEPTNIADRLDHHQQLTPTILATVDNNQHYIAADNVPITIRKIELPMIYLLWLCKLSAF